MGMYHSTSGKRGFEPHYVASAVEFTLEQAKAILELEEELRASPAIQAKYTERDDFEWLRDVTLDVQREVLRRVVPDIVATPPPEPFAERHPVSPTGMWTSATDASEPGMAQALRALHNLRFRADIANNPELSDITVCTCRVPCVCRTLHAVGPLTHHAGLPAVHATDQRFDKSHEGRVRSFGAMLDVPLHAVDSGEETSLLSFTRTLDEAGPGPHPQSGPPLVVVAGSVS